MENQKVKDAIQLLSDASEQYGETYENRHIIDSDFELIAQKMFEMFSSKWVGISVKEIPTTGKEYLVRNDNQGKVLKLVNWNKIHHRYESKGKPVNSGSLGTHWCEIN